MQASNAEHQEMVEAIAARDPDRHTRPITVMSRTPRPASWPHPNLTAKPSDQEESAVTDAVTAITPQAIRFIETHDLCAISRRRR